MSAFLATYRRTPAQRAMDRRLKSEHWTDPKPGSGEEQLPMLVSPPCPACGYDRASAGKCAGCGAGR